MSSQEARVLMQPNSRYGHTNEPGYDLVFCSIAELMDNECPNSPCQDCYLYRSCIRWWDQLCEQSIRSPLPDEVLDRTKAILQCMDTVKKFRSKGYKIGATFWPK